MSNDNEDKFPSYPPGGYVRIPPRLLKEADNDVTKAFLLWWAEETHREMESIIADLAYRKSGRADEQQT